MFSLELARTIDEDRKREIERVLRDRSMLRPMEPAPDRTTARDADGAVVAEGQVSAARARQPG